jgi:hypothetical protein
VPDVDDRILERVRKLLARAEHPTTPPAEAEACSEKAAALMSRYVIDQAMLDDARLISSAPETRRLMVPAPYCVPKAVLLSTVGQAFRVCVAVGPRDVNGTRRCTVVGFPADLDTVELLFTSLLLQATTAMLAASDGRVDVRAFRHAFLLGYAGSIGRRLTQVQRAAEEEAASATPGTSVVLRDRSARVEEAFAAAFPQLGSMRTTMSSAGGLTSGRIAGERADLSATQRRVGGSRRQLAG